MRKKIISFALAVAMLFSLLAISASALDDDGIGYRVVSDAVVGMQAGEIVTVKVYYVLPDAVDLSTYRQSLGNVVLAYNKEYYQVLETPNIFAAREFGSEYSGFFKTTIGMTHSTAFWNQVNSRLNANDLTKGYSDALLVGLAYESGGTYNATTGFPVVPECEIFSVKFVVQKTLVEGANIGIPAGTLNSQTYARYQNGTSSLAYASNKIDLSEGIVKSNYVKINFNNETKIRKDYGDPDLVDIGFTGSFLEAGIPINIVNGFATNVSAVGVAITNALGEEVEYEDNYVYPNANNDGYLFRATVTDIPDTAYDTPLKARMFVVYNDVKYYSDYVYTTAGAHVDRLP